MPVAIAAAAISAGMGAAAGVTIAGLSVAATAAVSFGAQLALGFLTSALAPKQKAPSSAGQFSKTVQDNILTIRQAAAPRKIVFGRTRVGGVYTFMHTTGSDNSVLHTVATVTGHSVRGFDALFLDDEIVPLDSNGDATGRYAGKVSCKFGLGTTAGDSAMHSALTSAVGSGVWGANHLQTGCAKAYVKFTYDEDVFGGGLPNPSFIVSGYSGVEDPRFATSPITTGWTDNPALCIAQYLRDTARGLGYGSANIDETALIAAANNCDEMVDRVAATVTFTATASTDVLTIADTSAHLRTGTRLTVSSSTSPAALPGGLAESTNYFWVPIGTTTGKLATSLANARAGTTIDITSAGTGTHTINVNAEPRYTCNGWIDTSEDPRDILPRLLAAMSGTKVETGGSVVLLAGVWRSAVNSIEEVDIDGRISSQHRRSRRDLFNGIKGVFSNPDDNFQPTDFPVVAPAAYLSEDAGERIWKDAELKFTDSPSMAQRIVRIDLENNRRQQSSTMPLTLAGMKHRAGDTVSVNNTKRGWSSKSFSVAGWSLDPRGIDSDNPRIGTTVMLDETDANVYAWTPGTDEAAMVPSPLTTLPDAFTSAPPTLLTLASGTAVLGIRLDGTVFSRIKASWTSPADAQVTSGGVIEVQYKLSSESAWQPSAFVDGAATEKLILDVDDGEDYDVRIRARRGALASPSDWVTSSDHTVIGKTTVPADVGSLSVQQNGVSLVFTWPQVSDIDLSGYEIRYMKAPFVWADATVMTSVTRGTQVTSSAVPPSPVGSDGITQTPWVFGIKARDTSENYSDNAATRSLTVFNAFSVIQESEHWPLWSDMRWRLPSDDASVFDVSDQDATPSDVFIKPDGQTMFVVGKTESKVFQYSLSTAWDLSTASAIGLSLDVSSEDTQPTGMAFSSDGETLFVLGAYNDRVYQYDLSIPWTLSSAAYSSNSLDVSSRNTDPFGIFVNSDGDNLYFVGLADQSHSPVYGDYVYRYALSTAWDLSTASYVDDVELSSPATTLVEGGGAGLTFKSDGTKMYVVVDFHSSVYQYSLSTAWDLSTVTYDSVAVRPGANLTTGIFIKPDGLRVYFAGKSADSVYEFALKTAWNMNSIELLEPNLQTSVDLSNEVTSHTGFTLVNGGTILLDMDGTDCYLYALSSPWNIASATYDSKTFDFSAQALSFRSIVLSDGGTKCFALGNGVIYQYTLSTAWDISTASYDSVSYGVQSVIAALPGSSSSSVFDIFIKPDGLKFYVADQQNDALYQFSMGSAWSLTGASYDSKTLDISGQEGSVYALFFSDDGDKIFAYGSNSRSIFEYELSTPWDISTGSYSSRRVTLPDFAGGGMFIAPGGIDLFVIGLSSALVYQYDLGRGFVRNPLTGNLNLFDGSLASGDDFNVFDNYATTPPASATYEADEVTIAGFDIETRIWADIGANLGPGETGQASAQLQVASRKSAEAYDGFANFTTGSVDARYVKGRIVSDTSVGATRLTGFNFVADAEETIQRDSGVAIGGSGTAIIFDEPYTSIPFLRVWNAENNDNLATYDSLTATGFTAYCRTGGGLTTGSINWESTGV